MEVPDSILENLSTAKRKDLQAWAKKYGIKANQSNSALIEAIKNLKSGSNTENTESKIDLIAPVVAEPVEEKSAFPLIADVTPVTSHASPKQAGPFEFHISPKAVREFKDSPKLNTSRRSTNTPKASPKLNSRRSVGTPKKTEIEFTFGSFASAADSARPSEETAFIASDETVTDKHTSQTSQPQIEDAIRLVAETPTVAEEVSKDEPSASSSAAPSDDEEPAANVSPRTRARVQQERAAARKAQLQQSNKAAVSKIVGGTPKGKPLTNSARQTASKASGAASGFKARPMPDFQKIHSKQFAQKASLDDFMAKRQGDGTADENVAAPSTNVPATSVSFKVTTPRDKVALSARPQLRPTTPFVRSVSAPAKTFVAAPKPTVALATNTTAAVTASVSKMAKPAPRPKFDLQASLARPMSWKEKPATAVVALKDKTNTAKQPQTTTTTTTKPAAATKPAVENKRQSVVRASDTAATSAASSTTQGTKRKSLATGGETADERRKKYGESLRRMSVMTN